MSDNPAPVVVSQVSQRHGFFKAFFHWCWNRSGLAMDINPQKSRSFYVQFIHAAIASRFVTQNEARGWILDDGDAEGVDPELIEFFRKVVAAEQKAKAIDPAALSVIAGPPGGTQASRSIDSARKEIQTLMTGMTKRQATGIYLIIIMSALLEALPAEFADDPSLFIRSLPLGLSTMSAGAGLTFHPGTTLAHLWNVLFPNRIIVGLPGRVAVLASVIDNMFATNIQAYLSSTLVPTGFLIAATLGWPLTKRIRERNTRDKAADVYEVMLNNMGYDVVRNGMKDTKDNLAAAHKLLSDKMKTANLGVPTTGTFNRIVAALKRGEADFDIARTLALKVDKRQKSKITKIWRAFVRTGKKGAISVVWLAVLAVLMVAVLGNFLQLTTQGLVVLFAIGQIIVHLVDTGAPAETLMHIVVLAVGPSAAQYLTVGLPLAFDRTGLTTYKDDKDVLQLFPQVRYAATVAQLILIWTVIPHVPDALIGIAQFVVRCFTRRKATQQGTAPPPAENEEQEEQDAVADLTAEQPGQGSDIPADYGITSQDDLVEELGPLETLSGPVDRLGALRLIDLYRKQALKEHEDPNSGEVKTQESEIGKLLTEAEAQFAFRRNILEFDAQNMTSAGVPPNAIKDILECITNSKYDRTKDAYDLNTEFLEEDGRFDDLSLEGITYRREVEIIETRQVIVHLSRHINTALEHIGEPTVNVFVELFDAFSSEDYGCYRVEGKVEDGAKHWGHQDGLAGLLVDASLVIKAVEKKQYWLQRACDRSQDMKVPRMLNTQRLKTHPLYRERAANLPDNFDYRHACLDGAHGNAVGVKFITSNPLNDQRQASVILVSNRVTGHLRAVTPGTDISSQRTAYGATKTLQTVRIDDGFHMYTFGAGPIASMCAETVDASMEGRVGSMTFSSTGQSAFTLVDKLQQRGLPFPVKAVNPAPGIERTIRPASGALKGKKVVIIITANPSGQYILDLEDVDDDAIIIDLSFCSLSDRLVQYVLEHKYGTVICDEIHTVAHRDGQSLSRYFTKQGLDLEKEAPKYNIIEFARAKPFTPKGPVLVSCSGLASLDVAVADQLLDDIEQWYASGN